MHPNSPEYIALNAPPSNLDAEQAVLGLLMYEPNVVDRLGDLEAAHFHEPLHSAIFEAIMARLSLGRTADPVLLSQELANLPAFQELGGLDYLADLVDKAPPPSVTRDYADAIVDAALRRALIILGQETAAAARKGEAGAKAILEEAEGALFDMAEKRTDGGGIETFASAVDAAMEMAEAAYKRDGSLSGLSTGLADLDYKLGGLHPSDLLILAGRPSMGKTALATNIAHHVAKHYAFTVQDDGSRKTTAGGQVLFNSLEMSKEQLAGRVISEVSGVSGDLVRKGRIGAEQFGRYQDASREVRDIPLHIDATGSISIAKLTQRARRHKRRHGLDLIIVDYLQLLTVDQGRGGNSNRTQDVSAITGGLKALAKDLNVPVIALSQLSRDVEKRDDKRPQLSDLRESGSIEQDADAVLFVYREEYYLTRAEPKDGTAEHHAWADELSRCQGLAEVIIGKQRHGPIGTVRLTFNGDTTKFGNVAKPLHEAQAANLFGGEE